MNYYYSRSDEVEADLKLALSLDDDAFEKEFQFDREDRDRFIGELEQDFTELKSREETEEWARIHKPINDWDEPYADPRLYI